MEAPPIAKRRAANSARSLNFDEKQKLNIYRITVGYDSAALRRSCFSPKAAIINGYYAEAAALAEKALALTRKIKGEDDPRTIEAMKDLALYYCEADREAEGRDLAEEAMEKSRLALGEEHALDTGDIRLTLRGSVMRSGNN